MHTHTHICTHTYINTYIYIYAHKYIYIHIELCTTSTSPRPEQITPRPSLTPSWFSGALTAPAALITTARAVSGCLELWYTSICVYLYIYIPACTFTYTHNPISPYLSHLTYLAYLTNIYIYIHAYIHTYIHILYIHTYTYTRRTIW